jgi:hypothetical protein
MMDGIMKQDEHEITRCTARMMTRASEQQMVIKNAQNIKIEDSSENKE